MSINLLHHTKSALLLLAPIVSSQNCTHKQIDFASIFVTTVIMYVKTKYLSYKSGCGTSTLSFYKHARFQVSVQIIEINEVPKMSYCTIKVNRLEINKNFKR